MKATFFDAPERFRAWLANNHEVRDELWVGYYKKGTRIPSITWPESVDEALCFGWIDGLRKSIDEKSYKIRFTPRRATSHWSAVNLARVKELKSAGRMQSAGIRAFENRNQNETANASYERKEVHFPPALEKEFKRNKKAWSDFQARSPSYRKQCTWWVASAKQVQTQQRRLDVLISCCQQGTVIPILRWGIKKKK